MKKLFLIFFAVICGFLFIQNTQAIEIDLVTDNVVVLAGEDGICIENPPSGCDAVLGDPDCDDSFAHLLQDIFDVIKFATPVLVLVLTIVEYTKAVVSNDKDMLAKASKVTIKRLILGLCLFMIPVLLNFVFDLLGWYNTYGTCGIG